MKNYLEKPQQLLPRQLAGNDRHYRGNGSVAYVNAREHIVTQVEPPANRSNSNDML
jgi:hypothetical protein